MFKIVANTTCVKCYKSSTFVKKDDNYVCANCGAVLCSEKEVINYIFPYQEKPYSNRGKNYGFVNKRKGKISNVFREAY